MLPSQDEYLKKQQADLADASLRGLPGLGAASPLDQNCATQGLGGPLCGQFQPRDADVARERARYHRDEANRHDQAAAFFDTHPEFAEFVDLLRKGVIPIALILAALLLPALAHSQSAVNATIPTAPAANLIHNLYAGGVSYNSSATPAVAGTGLYARLLSDTGTYAFTDVDALPNTVRPFTVTTNMGVGMAQKVATIGTIPVFIPAATGVSFSGSNTGWQWNTGALAAIRVKGNCFVVPQVRLVKSSVSNGSGYQPIIGVLFAWGS